MENKNQLSIKNIVAIGIGAALRVGKICCHSKSGTKHNH